MKNLRWCFVGVFVSVSISLSLAGGQDTNYSLRSEYVTMTDGIKLATDVYLPLGQGPFPCIMERTPYNKVSSGVEEIVDWFTSRGIAVVAQDCRGKYASQGVFYPFRNERADGLVAAQWVRSQKWSNGKIAGHGGSYDGYTQWAISDALDLITAHFTGADLYKTIYPDGLFSLESLVNWAFVVDSKETNDIPADKLKASFTILPLSVADDLTYADNQYGDDWLSHSSNDAYWKLINQQRKVDCPVLSVGGWYDMFLMNQIDDFQTMLRDGHPDNRIVLGPWSHGPQGTGNDYGGDEKTGNRMDLIRSFIVSQLLDSDVQLLKPPFADKKYNLFIMERNEYYGADQWPPRETLLTKYYIGEKGYISTEQFSSNGHLEYRYDPSDPYPSRGGTTYGSLTGQAFQNDNISRRDKVVFETDVIKTPVTLLGPIGAELYVGSDAVNTDFIVCVQDVFTDGRIVNIQEGGRAIEFDGKTPRKVELSIWATGYQLNEGHKLRVVITSSWFPRFNRNLNMGEKIYSAKTMRPAHQKVYFGPKYPSAIILPVLKQDDCLR